MEIDHEEGSKINREELVEINIEERNEIDLEERTEINCEELNETDCDEINVISNERNEGSSETTENGFSLFKVAPYSSGEGLPYAPVDWPLPGDKWRWKVGKRTTATGFFMDRYLYYPDRLQSLRKGRGFASKLSVKQYLQTIDGADVNKFFSSFSWKIPSIEGPGIKGTKSELPHLSLPYGEKMEHSGSYLQLENKCCKARNRVCSSLTESGEAPLRVMFCDICCSEPDFCRDCCCILCCRSVDLAYGGYSFIRCEASGDDGFICGHIGHLNCSLWSHLAGKVGGCIGLDAEYYCRRCDARTDLVPHVSKLLKTCESVKSRGHVGKILDLGASVLRGSQRTSAKRLLYQIELAMEKLENRTPLEDVWKMPDISAIFPEDVASEGNNISDSAKDQELVDATPASLNKLSEDFDVHTESLKLENDADQILLALMKSQELENDMVREAIHEQKKYIQTLYEHLKMEHGEFARRRAYVTDPEALRQVIAARVDQIKREVMKFKEMGEIANGSGRLSKEMKERFGMEM